MNFRLFIFPFHPQKSLGEGISRIREYAIWLMWQKILPFFPFFFLFFLWWHLLWNKYGNKLAFAYFMSWFDRLSKLTVSEADFFLFFWVRCKHNELVNIYPDFFYFHGNWAVILRGYAFILVFHVNGLFFRKVHAIMESSLSPMLSFFFVEKIINSIGKMLLCLRIIIIGVVT